MANTLPHGLLFERTVAARGTTDMRGPLNVATWNPGTPVPDSWIQLIGGPDAPLRLLYNPQTPPAELRMPITLRETYGLELGQRVQFKICGPPTVELSTVVVRGHNIVPDEIRMQLMNQTLLKGGLYVFQSEFMLGKFTTVQIKDTEPAHWGRVGPKTEIILQSSKID